MGFGEYIANSNTKLLLHFNGNSNDGSGNGNNGTDTNITYSNTQGKFGKGILVTNPGRIDVGNNSSLNVNAPMTISAWAYPANTNGGIIICRNYNWLVSASFQYCLFILSSKMRFTPTTTPVDDAYSTTAMSLNAWHHLCVTIDSSYNGKFYLDGQADGTFIKRNQTQNYSTLIASRRAANSSVFLRYA